METQPAREARRCRRSKRFAEKKFDDTWPSGQRRDPAPINPHRYTDADANWLILRNAAAMIMSTRQGAMVAAVD
jgi:hypothetical protein